ncbi:hypothetical protein GMSM_31420 [Geomonas sp. Red276]
MISHANRRPVSLNLLAAVYLFSFLLSASSYGSPYPFLGKLVTGGEGHFLTFADSLVSLYLCLGILKRQRLTYYLLLCYNLFDLFNALVNLWSIPPDRYTALSGVAVTPDDMRLNTLIAGIFVLGVTWFTVVSRRHFTNRSPYLF